MDALGAEIIPDPTTAGDFLRRFSEGDVLGLMEVINGRRKKVWDRQPSCSSPLTNTKRKETVSNSKPAFNEGPR
jgi:hypothetical protein